MMGVALMPNDDSTYYTSHDTYVDFVLIAGLPLLISYVCLLVGTTLRLRSPLGRELFRQNRDVGVCAFGMIMIIVVGGAFSAGETFQPVVASVWCILTGIAMRIESKSVKGLRLKWGSVTTTHVDV